MSIVGKEILFRYLDVTLRVWWRKCLEKHRNIRDCCRRQPFAFCTNYE